MALALPRTNPMLNSFRNIGLSEGLTALFPHGHGFATSYSLFHIPPPFPIHNPILVLICPQSLKNMPDYTYKSSGTNSQGNHYCARDYGSSASNSNSYHYSNQ
ncbi:hypothetical protein H0G86_004324 [Trichoderma simmonsii]|uniref:Uncharacterized protein n=1 Tax=Trichoderma simmonsii TaxID=1491479 RepID=A0A8G0L7B9_9HYPO|nr:hypothetical protein H0G86_004324 [Trichoderma simmonsii]